MFKQDMYNSISLYFFFFILFFSEITTHRLPQDFAPHYLSLFAILTLEDVIASNKLLQGSVKSTYVFKIYVLQIAKTLQH
jgi:hypothetical protein